MKTIGKVLRGMSFQDHVAMAERAERARRTCERMRRIEHEQALKKYLAAQQERAELARIGRPEYRYLKNALRKEQLYARRKRTEARDQENFDRWYQRYLEGHPE
jgi:hypothetical protein